MDLGDDVDAVDDERRALGHPQRDVQHGPVLGDIDLVAAEHGVAMALEIALASEVDEQAHRLVGDPVLRVVEVQPGRLGGHPLTAFGIVGEQLAEVHVADLGVVARQRRPRRAARAGWRGGHGAGLLVG